MALRKIRIGALEDVFQYDDADFPGGAVETDQPMKAGSPIDSDDVLRKADVGSIAGDIVGPATSTDANMVEFDGLTGKKVKDGGLTHANVADAISKKHSNALDHTQNTDTTIAPPVSSTLTIVAGVVTVAGNVFWRRHTIDTEGGTATDDLTTINGGNAGEILIISAANDMRDVICKQGTGLLLQADFTLDSVNDTLMLECKSANVWREVGGRCNNG